MKKKINVNCENAKKKKNKTKTKILVGQYSNYVRKKQNSKQICI